MAKGGNSQRSNCSRFTKPRNTSNSFVAKVASRVSDYLGGWFGTPIKSQNDAEESNTIPVTASRDDIEIKRSSIISHKRFDNVDTLSSPAKRFKISEEEKVNIDFPVSPIPSTSGLFQSTINHTFDIPKSVDFISSIPGPSTLQVQRYSESNNGPPATSTVTGTDVKTNGANDNHSDSSESTSGCSSLVPQSDRLSQSAYISSSRKKTLEEKLNYARQFQQSRASMFLNRSIPINDPLGGRKKPSFDVTAYGTAPLDKSLLKEKLMNSPFYTGQTSYGGASAYRLSRNSFYSQRNPRNSAERREGLHVKVKPSYHGSTEDLSNMSHTAKKILEALEQFSTPVSDAKRIPVNRLNVPLGSKRRRFDDLSETRLKLSTPISPLNPNSGPVITGLNVPTVPDLLKLKRLEKIQNSTAAARQVAVQKQEYSLPSEEETLPPTKRKGKITTKLKDKGKAIELEKLEEINLPKIPLPITTLPKFDFQFPLVPQPTKTEKTKQPSRLFTFSNPIPVPTATRSTRFVQKNNFEFSEPLKTGEKRSETVKSISLPFTNFMSSDTVAKLKRRSINDKNISSSPAGVPSVPVELKTGSVMDFLSKTAGEKIVEKEPLLKAASDSWECGNCLIRNLSDTKICRGCKASKESEVVVRTSSSSTTKVEVAEPKLPVSGFGDKFKPPSGSWSCKECFVNNKESADKCIACETPKVSATHQKKDPLPEPPKPSQNNIGFGDLFKKQANQWECSVCMIRNKETDSKCAACQTPKPGLQVSKPEPKFNFGVPPANGGFKFGIDKADGDGVGIKSAADSSTFKIQSNGPKAESPPKSQFGAISTSVGIFTFGIPPTSTQDKKEESSKATLETSSSGFMVTSTSGSSIRKDAPLWEQPSQPPQPLTPDSKAGKVENRVFDSKKPENEAPNSFFFDVQNKSSENQSIGLSSTPQENIEQNMEPNKKTQKFSFGSNSNSLDTVSSSTTDFAFGQTKPTTSAVTESKFSEPTPTASTQSFQIPVQNFGTFGSAQATISKSSSNQVEVSKSELQPSSVSTSVTTSGLVFGSVSVFNNSVPKMSFGTSSTPSATLGFGVGTSESTNSSPFTAPPPSFSTPAFSSQPPTVSTANSFGIIAQPTEKALNTTTFFGGAGPFLSTENPFASSNPLAPKSFGGFGTSVPNFGNNSTATSVSTPTPAPTFGSGFMQTSNAAEKPFIFGASSTAPSASFSTSASSSVGATPGVFTFGAAKTDSKPAQFTFGQSGNKNFNFGGNLNSNLSPSMSNLFGGISQPKPENSMPAASSPFGGSATQLFGQATAPAALESSVPKFEFVSQPQEATSAIFQFGSAPAQPQAATAPPSTGFSFSVPPRFNFTGGQAPVFSAESPSLARPNRRTIKAVRRTNRDNTRRPN